MPVGPRSKPATCRSTWSTRAPRGVDFTPHRVEVALRVPDVPEAKRELESKGVAFSGEHDTGVCKMAFFDDSEGNALMLHRRYAP